MWGKILTWAGVVLLGVSFSASAATLRMTGITVQDGKVAVSWQGGNGPYQLLCRTNVGQDWVKFGPVTSATSATNTAGAGPSCFYAVTSDLTPPTVPAGVAVTTNDCSTVTVRWNAAFDNFGGSGVKSYSVFRNGTLLREVNAISNSIVDGGLNNLTTYNYTVAATDIVGNQSAPSSPVSLTTHCNGSNRLPVAAAGADRTATAGSSVSFNGAGSWDPDGAVVSYSWNFGDGATATGATTSHAYSLPGSYVVTLTVTDNVAATATDTALITVTSSLPENQRPTANAGPNQSGRVGSTLTFNSTGSSDADGAIVGYSWNFGDGTTGSGATATHAYSSAGQYTVTLTVTDDDSATATDTASISITNAPANQAPVANAGPNQNGTVGVSMSFTAAGSRDPDGTIASFSWNFGDNLTATGSNVTHTYSGPGTYVVTLSVTDNSSAVVTDTAVVTVVAPANRAPVANAGLDRTVVVGTSLAFNGSGSQDPDGTITAYSWNFGDGYTATGSSTAHAYSVPGQYTVTLTVWDNADATGSDTAIISVQAPANQAPTANAGPNKTNTVGVATTLSGAGSVDPDGTITAYSWNFGDNTTGSGVSPSHIYAAAGTYTATLTVTDNAGATASDTAVVTIRLAPNVVPVANAGPDRSTSVGGTVTLDGTGSYDADGSIVSYAWNFGDGTTGSGASPSHPYSAAGTYTATLTVTDNSGATASDAAMVTVGSAQPSGTMISSMSFPWNDTQQLDAGYAVATDADANVILGGTQGGNVFLTKLSPSRSVIWNYPFGTLGAVRGIAVAANGDIFVTGNFAGGVTLGSDRILSQNSFDIFVAKLSPGGVLQWFKVFGSGYFTSLPLESGYGIALAPDGDLVVAGTYQGGASFGGSVLAFSGGDYDLFIAKLSAVDGSHRWSKGFGSAHNEAPRGLAVDRSGNIFITGALAMPVNFGGDTLSTFGGRATYIAKFSSTGAHRWSKSMGNNILSASDVNSGYALAVDANNDVVVTGLLSGAVDFGGGALSGAGANIFVAKYNGTTGAHIWSKRAGESEGSGNAMAIDSSGNITIVGGWVGGPSLGGGSVYLTSFSSDGASRWSKRFESTFANPYAVAASPAGRAFTTGTFKNPINFGLGAMSSAGGTEILLTEFVP